MTEAARRLLAVPLDWLLLVLAVLALFGWIAAVWWAGGRPWGDLDPRPGNEDDADA